MVVPTALLAFSFFSAALGDSPTQGGSPASPSAPAVTAPPSGFKLRKRQNNRQYVCGYDPSGESVTCPNHDLHCAATVYGDKNAYVYCSTVGAVGATVTTTAYASWNTNSVCPSLAYCCSGDYPLVQTNHYLAGDYTVTGYACTTANRIVSYNPARNVLWPPRFSASLVQAVASASSQSDSGPTNTSSAQNSDSGMSSGTKIGIGAGVGAGVGIVLLCAAIFFFRRRQKQKKKEKAANAFAASHGPYTETAQTPHSPQTPFSPPVYQETQFKNDSHPQEAYTAHKIQPVETYTAYQPARGAPASSPVELPSGPGPHELHSDEVHAQELRTEPHSPKR